MLDAPLGSDVVAVIGRVVADLDIYTRLAGFVGLTDDDRSFLYEYFSEETRAALELGVMIEQLLETARNRGLAGDTVCDDLRRNEAFRSRNFGVADAEDDRFMQIALCDRGWGLIEELERVRQDAERRFGTAGLSSNRGRPGNGAPAHCRRSATGARACPRRAPASTSLPSARAPTSRK